MSQKRFYFIRHGESHWNVKKLCQGQTDIELTEKGIQEAKDFAIKSAHFHIDHICTSPLKRALQTAEIIHEHHPKAGFTLISEFAERNWGHLQGTPSVAMFETEKLEETDPNYQLHPSIESRQDLISRINKGLELAFAIHPEPLIVSHGRLFVGLCELLNIPIIRQIKNLCFIEFTKNDGVWSAHEIHI